MTIEPKYWPWKPSLFNQYRIRIANELCLAQRQEHCNDIRRQISFIEGDIKQILQQIQPIDFTQIHQKLNSCIEVCEIKQKQTLKEYNRIKNQLINLTPKLLIGHAYLHARFNENPIEFQPLTYKKRRKRLKLTIEQQWKKGIRDAYEKLQIQRDKQNVSVPIINDIPIEEPPIIEHEFLPPLPPPPLPIDDIIIPFETPPPLPCPSPPSDRLQLAVDDTIVKPHRLINKTLGNISHMSFHIDPDQCSSPKTEERKKQAKLKKLIFPPTTTAAAPLPPPAPLFSSTAIFDTHAFFTQTNTKTKKQKKKIDISRQPVIMTTNELPKKKVRTKKLSPYDFNDDDNITLSRTKTTKLLTDDIITARFAKNSHYQSHQTSMASTKSQSKSNECEHKKKKKKNILGIGTSSPLTLTTNLTLSPGKLSIDDDNDDDDYSIKSSLSKRQNRTNKSKRIRRK